MIYGISELGRTVAQEGTTQKTPKVCFNCKRKELVAFMDKALKYANTNGKAIEGFKILPDNRNNLRSSSDDSDWAYDGVLAICELDNSKAIHQGANPKESVTKFQELLKDMNRALRFPNTHFKIDVVEKDLYWICLYSNKVV